MGSSNERIVYRHSKSFRRSGERKEFRRSGLDGGVRKALESRILKSAASR